METKSLDHLPVLLSNSCHQKKTRAGKLQTVNKPGLGGGGQKASRLNNNIICLETSLVNVGSNEGQKEVAAYHWHTEQRNQPAEILLTLPQLHHRVL